MRTLLIVSLLAASAGCKDKPKRKVPPANPSTPTATPAAPGQQAPDLELPHSAEGGPPKKTTKPHTKADYEKLAKLELKGFISQVQTVGEKVFEVRNITPGHPRFWATVTIKPCLDCIPMELPKWQAKADDLMVLLGPLKGMPNVQFEVGETTSNGAPVMYTYQIGDGSSPGGEGGATQHFTDAFAAYYNDGINEIRVIAEYKDDPKSASELAVAAPKDHLAMLALSMIDVYTHAW